MISNKKTEIKTLQTKLKLSKELTNIITKKYDEYKDIARLSGKRPNSVLAAITYHWCKEIKDKRNQEDITEILNITQVTLRNVLNTIYNDEKLDSWIREDAKTI